MWPSTTRRSYAPACVAPSVVELTGRLSPAAVVAAGNEVGNEVMAHVAAKLDLPLAANCIDAAPGDSAAVTRVRWGGSLLEEASLHAPLEAADRRSRTPSQWRLSRAATPQSSTSRRRSGRGPCRSRQRRVEAAAGGISLADAKVVVSRRSRRRVGRGLRRRRGACRPARSRSRVLACCHECAAGGRTPIRSGRPGTKISPDIYIACGISGATQHIAGCKGAKKILAINTDPEAPIFASADYAVIGDLHEILPAISRRYAKGALRRLRRLGARALDRRSALALAALLVVAVGCSGAARGSSGGSSDGQACRALDEVPQRLRAEAEIVLGQRKLLQRLEARARARVHLLGLPRPVSDDRDRSDRCGRPRLHAALARPAGVVRARWSISLPCSCSSASSARFWIRKVATAEALRGQPSRRGRPHPRADRRHRVDAAALARGPDRARAQRMAGGLVTGLEPLVGPVRRRRLATRSLERVFMWAHVALILGFLAYLPYSKHLHIFTAAVNVLFGRTRARGRLEPLRFDEDARGGAPLRRRHRRRPHLEADGGRVLLHGVRPLPGRLPGLRDREGAVAQAPDHGRPRPAVRGGAARTRRRRA